MVRIQVRELQMIGKIFQEAAKGARIAEDMREEREDRPQFGACGRVGRGSRVNGVRTTGKSGGRDGYFADLLKQIFRSHDI